MRAIQSERSVCQRWSNPGSSPPARRNHCTAPKSSHARKSPATRRSARRTIPCMKLKLLPWRTPEAPAFPELARCEDRQIHPIPIADEMLVVGYQDGTAGIGQGGELAIIRIRDLGEPLRMGRGSKAGFRTK